MRVNAKHCKDCRFFCPTFGVKKYGACLFKQPLHNPKKVRPQDFSCKALVAKRAGKEDA